MQELKNKMRIVIAFALLSNIIFLTCITLIFIFLLQKLVASTLKHVLNALKFEQNGIFLVTASKV